MIKKKICILGFTGSLNKHLIELLNYKKYQIIVITRKKQKNKKNVNFIKSNLISWYQIKKIPDELKKVNVIINAASNNNNSNISEIKKTNIRPINNILKFCRKISIHNFHISSFTTNYFRKKKYHNHLKNNFYLRSKYISENKIIKFKKLYKKITILKPTSLFGFSKKKNIFNNIFYQKKFYNINDKTFNLICNFQLAKIILIMIEKETFGIFEIISNKMYSLKQILLIFNKFKKIKFTNTTNLDLKNKTIYPDLSRKIESKQKRIIINSQMKKAVKFLINKRYI